VSKKNNLPSDLFLTIIIQNYIFMGNCQGFCVTNGTISSENEIGQKKHGVTVDRVQMALQEKDAMFG
jgi:hypothetical protein